MLRVGMQWVTLCVTERRAFPYEFPRRPWELGKVTFVSIYLQVMLMLRNTDLIISESLGSNVACIPQAPYKLKVSGFIEISFLNCIKAGGMNHILNGLIIALFKD